MTRIMVVDDDPDFCEITRIILEQKGYEVATAANGPQGLALASETKPDLVILDVMMKGVLDGLETAHDFEEDQQLHGVPIIMVSSIADSDMSGMFPTDEYIPIDAWISKPVQPEVLLKKVARLLHKEAA